jgi:hypothetical protein
VSAQVYDSSSAQVVMDDVQDQIVSKVGIPGHGVHVQGGIDGGQLQQVCGDGVGFIGVGRADVIEQDQVEAARGIGQLQG